MYTPNQSLNTCGRLQPGSSNVACGGLPPSGGVYVILSISRLVSEQPRVDWGVHRGRGLQMTDDI